MSFKLNLLKSCSGSLEVFFLTFEHKLLLNIEKSYQLVHIEERKSNFKVSFHKIKCVLS